jgi:phenylpropionate dioxygenase-like ring-hydroxylating dioxygenase large terminal subunit
MRNFDINAYIRDDPKSNTFEMHRDVFRDPGLFEMEMRSIFEGGWVFVCLASQLPEPFDFHCMRIGRRPVVVTRDGEGGLHCFHNTCRHRGATLRQSECGNSKFHVCDYHGWAYDAKGQNIDIKDQEAAHYPESFKSKDHDLLPVARFAAYRDLLFASLSPDVLPLEEYLGDARVFIDLVLDQGGEGMELVPGRSRYTYDANWKFQLDNGVDAYHLTSTHRSFAKVVQRRTAGESENKQVKSPDFKSRFAMDAGMFTLENGHALLWADHPTPEDQPVYGAIDALRRKVGPVRAKWMLRQRNLTIFPNLQLADTSSLILRTFTPLAVDRTEMNLFCLAPVGEADAPRSKRIRQHEDFFNVSGLATPDDTACYENCQAGLDSGIDDWLQCFERGMMLIRDGGDPAADELEINPRNSLYSTYGVQNEVCYHAAYREWARRLSGVAK